MPGIDFSILPPIKNPGPEIASIGDMLSSFAEQRMKQQQIAADREWQQRKFEADQANTAADNARADAQLEQLKKQHQDAQAAQAAREQDAAQKEAYKAVPGVKNALLAGDEPGARVAAGAGGITLNVDQSQAQEAQQAQQTRGQQMADSLSPFGPMLGGAMPVAAASATAAAPTDAEKAKRYLMGLPGSKVPLPYSPDEEQQAQRAQREKQSGELGAALQGTSPSPYSAQGIREAQGLMKTGQLKESPADWVAKRVAHLEDQANAKENARTRAASFGAPGEKTNTGIRGDLGNLDASVQKFFNSFAGKDQYKAMNTLHAAWSNLNTTGKDSVIAHKDALIQMAKYFRGTVPTESEMKTLYDEVGGVYGSMDTFIKKLQSGDVNAATIENLTKSARVALEESEANRKRLFGGMVELVGPGTEFEGLAPQVNKKVRAYAKAMGLDEFPDVYPGATGGAQLGSGRRVPVTTGRPAPAGGGTPAKATDFYLQLLRQQQP